MTTSSFYMTGYEPLASASYSWLYLSTSTNDFASYTSTNTYQTAYPEVTGMVVRDGFPFVIISYKSELGVKQRSQFYILRIGAPNPGSGASQSVANVFIGVLVAFIVALFL